jgi:hypothetical protein
MKKLLALVLTIALMCCVLTSCDDVLEKIWPDKANDPIALIEKADKALTEAPYIVTVKNDFESNHKNVHDRLAALNGEVPMTIDGENISINMSTKASGYTLDMSVIVVDKVMYYSLTMLGETAKVKVNLNDEQYKDYMEMNKPGLTVGAEDFGELTVETKDGKKYISCNQLSKSGIKKINDVMEEGLESANVKADISFTGLSFTIVLSDGKYESIEEIITYDMKIDGGSYTVTLTSTAKLSYDDAEAVTAPADAQKYQTVDYDDLVG